MPFECPQSRCFVPVRPCRSEPDRRSPAAGCSPDSDCRPATFPAPFDPDRSRPATLAIHAELYWTGTRFALVVMRTTSRSAPVRSFASSVLCQPQTLPAPSWASPKLGQPQNYASPNLGQPRTMPAPNRINPKNLYPDCHQPELHRPGRGTTGSCPLARGPCGLNGKIPVRIILIV